MTQWRDGRRATSWRPLGSRHGILRRGHTHPRRRSSSRRGAARPCSVRAQAASTAQRTLGRSDRGARTSASTWSACAGKGDAARRCACGCAATAAMEPVGGVPVDPEHGPDPARRSRRGRWRVRPGLGGRGRRGRYRLRGDGRCGTCASISSTPRAPRPPRTACAAGARAARAGRCGAIAPRSPACRRSSPASEWGADQCPPRAAPAYGEVQHRVRPPHRDRERVRARRTRPRWCSAICRYHRNSNGWNDIGYNFLVDQYGQIFEGRAGGIDAGGGRRAGAGLQRAVDRHREPRHVQHRRADRRRARAMARC